MNILVIDIGTSSMRGVLYRESGKKVFMKQIHYHPVHDGDGRVEQNPEDFETALVTIIRMLTLKAEKLHSEVNAISITSQRSSVIPVDKDGLPLMNAIMWQDTRNKEICEELQKHNEIIHRISGANVNCVFSGGKMKWIRNTRPDIYERIYKMVNIPEYLIHVMTGEYVSDYTYGSRSNLMNLRKCDWDEELLELFQVKREHLCSLKAPGEISGYVTEEFAEKTGLYPGIPVISAGGDQQCAAVGQGAYKEGVMSIVTGTGAFLMTTCDQIPKNLSPDVICNCAAVRGKYVIETNVLTCCSAFDWFCKTFYDWKEVDYKRINDELNAIYGKKSTCVVLPYFQGRSTPDWNASARASFHNISLGTKREEILKSIIEGIFMEIDNNIQFFRKYVEVESASISGGLTNSKVMNQMQADIYGIPLMHYKDSESTANGAFMIAISTLCKGLSMDDIFYKICTFNEQEKYIVCKSKYQNYRELMREMNNLYQKIYE